MTDRRHLVVQNPTLACLVITDVQVGGTSIYPALRAELVASGKLEDGDDCVTLLPGESFHVQHALEQSDVTIMWEEPAGG